MNKIDFIKNNFGRYFVKVESGTEGVLIHKKYGGRKTNNRSFVYTLTKMLEPKYILDIGSWHYEGANSMAKALDGIYKDDKSIGIVHSFDLRKGGYDGCGDSLFIHKRVKPMFWYPHHTPLDHYKYDEGGCVYGEFKDMSDEDIFSKNESIIKEIVPATGYDLVFIDGDHSYIGVGFDWKYANLFSSKEAVIAFDDVWDDRMQDVRRFYDELDVPKYDFEDWNDNNIDITINNAVTIKRV